MDGVAAFSNLVAWLLGAPFGQTTFWRSLVPYLAAPHEVNGFAKAIGDVRFPTSMNVKTRVESKENDFLALISRLPILLLGLEAAQSTFRSWWIGYKGFHKFDPPVDVCPNPGSVAGYKPSFSCRSRAK